LLELNLVVTNIIYSYLVKFHVITFRAIYFAMYAKSSRYIIRAGIDKDSPLVHTCAGASAGKSCS
jgi:hypothetical protein